MKKISKMREVISIAQLSLMECVLALLPQVVKEEKGLFIFVFPIVPATQKRPGNCRFKMTHDFKYTN
jgi:hypothetical protein